ncbi:MAG: hypothetical protein JSS38_11015 [Nitrospira sp.]|nr:hypothetical protein [Nitrospira sp.]
MKVLLTEKLNVGDLILTTTSSPISQAIRLATKGDISHAMLYVDTCSVVDATLEGVQARNTQRILLENDRAVHVLRLKDKASSQEIISVCDYVRARIGTQYSVKEAIRSGIGGSDTWTRKQFCSRLVAQAYASVGIHLVADENFCSPNDILESNLLKEIYDVTRAANEDDLRITDVTDKTQLMRDATNKLLKCTRAKNKTIEDINDILAHLQNTPSDDDYFHNALIESGYLTVWQRDIDECFWRYDLATLEAMPATDKVKSYCLNTLNDVGRSRRRCALNASGHDRLFQRFPLKTFKALRDLDALLLDLLHARRYTAATWLSRHAPNALQPIIHVPHTPEWFIEYEIEEPDRAALTRIVLSSVGREDVCSICGDDPAADYRMAGFILPGILTCTLRLCEDCLKIRTMQFDEMYVPLQL